MTKQKRLAKMVITGPTGIMRCCWYKLIGGNGEIMFTSEMFTRRADARRAMRRAIQIIQSGQYKVEE